MATNSTSTRRLLLALVGLLLLGGLWMLSRNAGTEPPTTASVATPTAAGVVGTIRQVARQAAPRTAAAPKPEGAAAPEQQARAVEQAAAPRAPEKAAVSHSPEPLVSRQLPSNVEVRVPEAGVESQLIAFLENPAQGVEPPVRFNLDRLSFETGSATLTRESDAQLQSIAEILRAYEKVNIKLSVTSNDGRDAEANLELSQQRASTIINALQALDVSPPRLSVEGSGDATAGTEARGTAEPGIAFEVTQK